MYDADGYDIIDEIDGVRINVFFDCQARHPFLKLHKEKWLFSGRGKRDSGEVCFYQIYLYPLSTKKPDIPIINRFPENYNAAFCLTDHADYDQVSTLKAIFWGDSKNSRAGTHGLSGRGIRVTKSIFARSFPEYTGIGFHDDLEFKKLIYRLHDEGNEIVPHGIRSFPGTTQELAKDLQETFSAFKPKTWIDHIYSYSTLLPHSLANEGLRQNSSNYIWSLLEAEGFDLVWSGFDMHHNPPKGIINVLDLSDNNSISYLSRSIQSMLLAHWKEGSYYVLEFIDNLAGLDNRILVKKAVRLLKSGNSNEAFRVIGKILSSLFHDKVGKIEKKQKVQLFSTQNRFPGARIVGTFSTMRLNSLGKGLSPEKWSKVYQDRGVVLLHTYLSCNHPLSDNAWEREGIYCRTTSAFNRVMEFLADQVKQKKLWNPTVHEMWEWYKEWKMVRLIPDVKTGEWKIINHPKKNIGFVNNCSLDKINRIC